MAGMTLPMFQTLRDLLAEILAELKATHEAVERIDKKLVGVKSAQKTTKADKAGKGKG